MNKIIFCFFTLGLFFGANSLLFAQSPEASSRAPEVPSSGLIAAQAVTDSSLAGNAPETFVLSSAKTPAPVIPSETLFWLYGLLFIGVGFFAYKFWKRGALVRSNSRQSKLQVLEMRMLGNKQFLLVVAYDGQRMLLGVSPGIIQHICILGEGDHASSAPQNSDFAELLGSGHSLMRKQHPKPDQAHKQ